MFCMMLHYSSFIVTCIWLCLVSELGAVPTQRRRPTTTTSGPDSTTTEWDPCHDRGKSGWIEVIIGSGCGILVVAIVIFSCILIFQNKTGKETEKGKKDGRNIKRDKSAKSARSVKSAKYEMDVLNNVQFVGSTNSKTAGSNTDSSSKSAKWTVDEHISNISSLMETDQKEKVHSKPVTPVSHVQTATKTKDPVKTPTQQPSTDPYFIKTTQK